MINLRNPQRTISQLKAVAASGSSGLAKQAQAEIAARMVEALKRGSRQ